MHTHAVSRRVVDALDKVTNLLQLDQTRIFGLSFDLTTLPTHRSLTKYFYAVNPVGGSLLVCRTYVDQRMPLTVIEIIHSPSLQCIYHGPN